MSLGLPLFTVARHDFCGHCGREGLDSEITRDWSVGMEVNQSTKSETWCTQSFNIYQSGLQNQGWFQQKCKKCQTFVRETSLQSSLKKGALSFCNHVDPSLHWPHWFVDRRASTKRNPRVGSSAGEWVSHACYGWIGWMNGCENRTLHGWVWQVMPKEISTSSWMAYI